MQRRQFLRTTSAAIGAAMLPSWLAADSKSKPPNLIFIFADQLRADALGYTGNTKAITPNIDTFASQSVQFSNAVSVMPVCAAYRASLLTGKYPSGHGMVINEVNMNPNHTTIAHVLKEAGYNLGYVGKWHLNDQHGRPASRGAERLGFDGLWAAYSFNHSSYHSYYYTDAEDTELIKVTLEGKHGPTEFTDIAINYVDEAAKQDRPFALFLSWNPPHDPWDRGNAPPTNYKRFEKVRFTLPENFVDTPDPYMDRYPGFAFNGQRAWKKEFLEEGLPECLRCYYAMVNNLDEQFGRIMTKLDDVGISSNTVVVFTSDHGEMFGSQGRMFKLTFYDEAARVPLLVRYPKNVRPGVSETCINTPDIMPTLLGLMALKDELPGEVEGSDLSFILRGEKGTEPEAAFLQGMGHTFQWMNGYEWRAVRDKRFTYAKYLRDGKELLFDRKTDPFMKKDVSADPSYQQQLKHLRSYMTKKMTSLNDEFRPCTWYRDHWMYKKYSVKTAAKGDFGPLPPIEPMRK